MRAVVLVSCFLAVGCGDIDAFQPAGPASAIRPLSHPDMTGRWFGTLAVTFSDGQRVSTTVFVRLQQDGARVTGTWSALGPTTLGFYAGQDVFGDVAWTVTGVNGRDQTFAGSLTWDSPSSGGGRCLGAGGVSGIQREGGLTMTAPSISLDRCTPVGLFWSISL